MIMNHFIRPIGLFRLLRLEWRNLRADRSPVVLAILLALAVGYGVWNGARWMDFQRHAIEEALTEESQRLAKIRDEIRWIDSGQKTPLSAFADPRLPQSFGRNMGLRYAAMPPFALGLLSVGQSDLLPYYFRVSTNPMHSFTANSNEIENPVHLLSGRFDLSFAIVFLLPLFIIGISYNVLSAEREGGTLLLALAQAISVRRLALAKFAVRVAFVLTVTTVVALTVAALAADPGWLGHAGSVSRLASWVVVTAAYALFWFSLAFVVNAVGRHSASNAVALVGFWLVFVVVTPPVLNLAIQTVYPVPSRVELIQAIRSAGEDATRKGSSLLARYLEDHPELAPGGGSSAATADFGTLLVALNDATEKSVQPVLARFEDQLSAQRRMAARLRYLSPAIVVQDALNDLAGSSTERHQMFLAQTAEYHRRWREFFIPRILRGEKLSATDVDRFPAFQFREEGVDAVLARCGVAFAGLAISVAAAAAAGMWAMRRHQVAG
jgi:ABC-2 type transport system permease protein